MVANDRIHNHTKLYTYFQKSDVISHSPKTVGRGNFKYKFDSILKRGDNAVFIKIFKDPTNNLQADELNNIRKAVQIVNKYCNSHVMIFSKRRFSDFAVSEAANDSVLMLVEVDRLRFC